MTSIPAPDAPRRSYHAGCLLGHYLRLFAVTAILASWLAPWLVLLWFIILAALLPPKRR